MEIKQIPVTYPHTRQDISVADNYFGTIIKDAYRWLEDDQSAETKEWVVRQNTVTDTYLSQIPYRNKIRKRIEAIFNFEKYGTPFKRAEKYYFLKNDGLQNQSVLYVQDNLNAPTQVALDPNTFSTDGTASLGEMAISKDGRYLAYTISKGGSDWRTIYIKDMLTGQMLDEHLQWAKFTGLAWQGNGFYYTRYPEPKKGAELTSVNESGAVYFHQLGTPQSGDRLVFNDEAHPNRSFGAGTTEDQRFLYVTGFESTSGNTLYFKNLESENTEFIPVSTAFDYDFAVIDNFGDKLLVLTNYKAPNKRLVLISSAEPAEHNWENLVPEDGLDVLESAVVCGGKIICNYLHNASNTLRVFGPDGQHIKDVQLPEIGSIAEISGTKDDPLAFFSFTSFLRPITIYALDMMGLSPEVFKAPRIDFNPEQFTTEQIFYQSPDGTEVPMFITRKKQIVYDGANPTLLYGYGGFNISVTPSFSASRAVLLENNGIYAVANIRGGGEFGEKWHKAGIKCKKQNVFDDFIAAAEYLIAKKYTSPEKLAIQGGSNGGLLVGACMTQRPELFGVCIPQVGVLDMLRYHKFTIGFAWATDYGRSDNEAEFPCLLKYSPLHCVKKTNYPATLVTTADHDDRVVPAHSFKYAAALQEYQQGENPVLIRIETSAGHGAGKPTSKIIDEAADILSFMLYNMNVSSV